LVDAVRYGSCGAIAIGCQPLNLFNQVNDDCAPRSYDGCALGSGTMASERLINEGTHIRVPHPQRECF
jgi:hypothetical protein